MSPLHILLLKFTLLSRTVILWVLRLLEQWNIYVVEQEWRAFSPSLVLMGNHVRVDQC
ncbi:hypothetical protein GYH30_043316 [Glycine max]|nr:hypothetical protein GYH30_043316 [Glycine max]